MIKTDADQVSYIPMGQLTPYTPVKVKISLYQAVETHRVVRRRGCHIFLDNRLTDGGEVVSHTRRPSFTPRLLTSVRD
jgi:hypothetical protein